MRMMFYNIGQKYYKEVYSHEDDIPAKEEIKI